MRDTIYRASCEPVRKNITRNVIYASYFQPTGILTEAKQTTQIIIWGDRPTMSVNIYTRVVI